MPRCSYVRADQLPVLRCTALGGQRDGVDAHQPRGDPIAPEPRDRGQDSRSAWTFRGWRSPYALLRDAPGLGACLVAEGQGWKGDVVERYVSAFRCVER